MTAKLDFIYIGTPKAGSTWLFEALRHHPEVQLFESKASKYFERDKPAPVDEYYVELANFTGTGKVGEISHDAYLYPHNARLLRQHFPEVKILFCLREPGDFARSLTLWLRTHTREYGDSAIDMLKHAKLRRWMDYANGIAPFLETFPREQIKIAYFDDFKSDPVAFYRDICGHIGVDPNWQPENLREIINPARAPRYEYFTEAVYKVAQFVRAAGFGALVERAKRSPTLEAALYEPGKTVDIGQNVAALQERARAKGMLDRLELLLDEEVPASWRVA